MSSIEIFSSFLADNELSVLINRYNNHKRTSNEDLGVNVFELISEIYHRENLHSDIIKFFLDPDAKHKEERKYLDKFLFFLKANDIKLNESDFNEVTREEGRVDILIKGQKKAIIVENKINNAGDTPRQLPTYFNKLKKNQFEVVAIIYLSLDGNKRPSLEDWTPEEIAEINKRLLFVSGYDSENRKKDLYHGWIEKCISDNMDGEARFILKHYGKLLKYLRGNIMDNQILKGYYDFFAKDNNYQKALMIREVLDDLGNYLVARIVEWYDSNPFPIPFAPPAIWGNNQVGFGEWYFKKSNYSIQIFFFPGEQYYQVCFFDQCYKWEEWDKSIELQNVLFRPEFAFEEKDDGYYKKFYYTEKEGLVSLEKGLFSFLEVFLKELNSVAKKSD